MFKNHIVIALRHLFRQKGYAFINIMGLAIGLACCILISLFVLDELSYDRFYKDSDRIYRVTYHGGVADRIYDTVKLPFGIGPALKRTFPEIEESVRFSYRDGVTVKANPENPFFENVIWAEDTFFKVFGFRLIRGNPAKALIEPYTLVISQKAAKKYFRDEDPLGKILYLGSLSAPYRITGIMEEIPANSHFKADFIRSIITLKLAENTVQAFLGDSNYYTYVRLKKRIDTAQLEKKSTDYLTKIIEPYATSVGLSKLVSEFRFQPIVRIHLYSHADTEIEENGDISTVLIMTAAAVLILVIASINFINFSIAQAITRAKEVGIRKVVGSDRKQLINQFLVESFSYISISIILAMVIAELAFPTFNVLSGKVFVFWDLFKVQNLALILGIFIVTGFLTGIYPAFFLSRFQPIQVLKPGMKSMAGGTVFKKALVIFQFFITTVLIICTITIYGQVNYMKGKDLGFKKENKLIIDLTSQEAYEKHNVIRSELMKNPNILQTCSVNLTPFRGWSLSGYKDDMGKNHPFSELFVGPDFINTMDLKLVQGRDFFINGKADEGNSIIVNEALVKRMAWLNPVGKKLKQWSEDDRKDLEFTVVGVVRNFNYVSLHYNLEPLVIRLDNSPTAGTIIANISLKNIPDTLGYVETVMKTFAKGMPVDFEFLDSIITSKYTAEDKMGKLIGIFGSFAIIVACLGLAGLAAYAAERRRKEIGIRKAIGATVNDIVKLLVTESTKWILIANLIAWPVAYYLMNNWLKNFAYRTGITIWIFVIAATITSLIAFISVLYQAVRAATADPVRALRYE